MFAAPWKILLYKIAMAESLYVSVQNVCMYNLYTGFESKQDNILQHITTKLYLAEVNQRRIFPKTQNQGRIFPKTQSTTVVPM